MASTCEVQEQRDSNTITLQALPPSEQSRTNSENDSSEDGFAALEKWNEPRINAYRSFATFWSMLVMGANDAAYGVSDCLFETV